MNDQHCSEVMTSEPVFCLPTDTVERAAVLMKECDVGAIPVVADADSRRVVGMITDRDIIVRVIAEGKSAKRCRVKGITEKDVVTCHASDPVEMAITAMASRQVRRIPVIDDEGRLVGIIAQADIAIRLGEPSATAEMVEDISQPRDEDLSGPHDGVPQSTH